MNARHPFNSVAQNPLLDSDAFSSLRDDIAKCVTKVETWDSVLLLGKLDLLSVFAIVQIEASLIDRSIKYQRKLGDYSNLDFRNHLGSIIIDPVGDFVIPPNIDTSKIVHLKNSYVDFEMGFDSRIKGGLIDVVAQAASIAESISPVGKMVKALRPWVIAGSWLRGTFDSTFDPAYILLKEHLRMEGSIKVVPITEVETVNVTNIDGLSENMLFRLKKLWHEMEISERSMALSELVLPVIKYSDISTSRIEELFWHRVVPTAWKSDIASHLSTISAEWKEQHDNLAAYAFTLMDEILSNSIT